MSCGFFEAHFASSGPPAEFELHRQSCEECRRLSEAFIGLETEFARLSLPSVPATLRDRWKAVSGIALDCDRAAELLARAIEEELAAPERRRLEFHLARCAACTEASEILRSMRSLVPAEPGPLALSKPPAVVSIQEARSRGRRGARWLDPRLYAAAACLLAGFFTIFATSISASGFGRSLRVRSAEAADRFQIWENSVSHRLIATREAVFGYGKAFKGIALSAAGRATDEILHAAIKIERGRKS